MKDLLSQGYVHITFNTDKFQSIHRTVSNEENQKNLSDDVSTSAANQGGENHFKLARWDTNQ